MESADHFNYEEQQTITIRCCYLQVKGTLVCFIFHLVLRMVTCRQKLPNFLGQLILRIAPTTNLFSKHPCPRALQRPIAIRRC